MSKFKGIDEREIKCCDTSETTIEAGISFDELENGQHVLRFHFLDYIEHGKDGKLENPILIQRTKSMYLNKENTQQLIESLRELSF